MPMPKLKRPPHPKPLVLVATSSLREGHARAGVRSGYSTALAAQRISPPALLARARTALEQSA